MISQREKRKVGETKEKVVDVKSVTNKKTKTSVSQVSGTDKSSSITISYASFCNVDILNSFNLELQGKGQFDLPFIFQKRTNSMSM